MVLLSCHVTKVGSKKLCFSLWLTSEQKKNICPAPTKKLLTASIVSSYLLLVLHHTNNPFLRTGTFTLLTIM